MLYWLASKVGIYLGFFYFNHCQTKLSDAYFFSAENVDCQKLVAMYTISCEKHGARPISRLISQLKVRRHLGI